MIADFRRMREMISLGTMMVQDAPARPGIGVALAAAFLSLTVSALVAPTPAQAQLQLFDPSAMALSTAQGWVGGAKSIANGIFSTLLVLEFTFFGIQFALFRDNLTDILGSMALKIITTGFFLWLISQADTLFPIIINSFTQSANRLTGGSATSSLAQLAAEIFAACALMYGSAATAQLRQEISSYFAGPFFYGFGVAGQANGLPVASSTSIMLEQVIIFLLISSLAVILMQWVITNIESYIVMFGGIIFLGFSGSRWTMPFAQGYLSYAINVGAKLFTLYLVLAIEANLGLTVLLPVAAASAVIAGDPTGSLGPLSNAILFWAAAQVMIMAAVAYAIPNLAGSFLSGQSSMSGAQALGTLTSSMASIRMANAASNSAANAAGRESAIGAQQASMNAPPSQATQSGPDVSTSTGTPQAVTPVGALVGASPNADAAAPAGASAVGGQNGTLFNNGIASAGNADAAPPARAPGGGQNGTIFSPSNGSPAQSAPRLDASSSRVSAPAAMSAEAPMPIGSQAQTPLPAAINGSSELSSAAEMVPVSASSANGFSSAPPPPALAGASASAAAPPSFAAAASSSAASSSAAAPASSLANASSSAAPPPLRMPAPSAPIPAFTPPPMVVGGSPAQTANAMALSQMAQQTPTSGSSSGQGGIDFNNLAAATPAQGVASVGRDPIETLSPAQWQQIPPETRMAMATEMKNQMASIDAQKQQSQAYAAQLLAQALPRDGAPPAAVQVRLSNPEKL